MTFTITGRLIEEDLLGTVDNSITFEEAQALGRRLNHQVGLEEALKHVRKIQPRDSCLTDPKTPFAKALHTELAKRLFPSQPDRIRYYVSIGSILDYWHGVDAFFDIIGRNGKHWNITIDVKSHEDRVEDIKADVLIVCPSTGLDPIIDKEEWQELVSKAAQDIINEMKTAQIMFRLLRPQH